MNLEDFNKKVMPTKNKLYRFALSYLKNEEEAKDIVQEVLLKVWNRKVSLSFYRNIEAWCMTLTKNLSLDRIKSMQFQLSASRENLPDIASDASPYKETELNSTISMVKTFIDNLPERQRDIIHLRDVEGYTYQEIADILNLDVNQVKVYLFRARKTVKQKMLNLETHGA